MVTETQATGALTDGERVSPLVNDSCYQAHLSIYEFARPWCQQRVVLDAGSGTGYGAAVGQTYENAVNVDWPRIDLLANYTRTIDWEAGTSVETFDRKPGLNPASWKYGLGWQDGTPTQKALRQTHIVSGGHAWHTDGDGPPMVVPPELAELYQLDLWLNPPGFLKAARRPGAAADDFG